MPDTKEEIKQKLSKFRLVDKYQSFHEILPEVRYADSQQKATVAEVLDNCAKELLVLWNLAKKRPTKATMKKVLQIHMNLISHAALDELNKEFAYRLCWFLAEKVDVNLPKQTAAKYWGYWKIVDDEVKTVKYKKPKKKLE